MPETTTAEVVDRPNVAYTDLTYSQPQQIVMHDTGVPGLMYVAGTTSDHGLQVKEIDARTALEQSQPRPNRPKGARQVSELLSFLDQLGRRPLTPGLSTLWGDYTEGIVTAVYNDHEGANGGWRDDQLVLKLTPDFYWKKWQAISDNWYSQEEFGDHLEELLPTVIRPDQADLLEIVNSIRTSSSGKFESHIDRSTGSQNLTYTNDVTASAGTATRTLEVPSTITLLVRPWEGHVQPYEIKAAFKLRVPGGNLALSIKLQPTQELLRQSWADVVTKIVDTVAIPVLAYRGTR